MNTSKLSKIKLYSTTTCPFCIMEAMWLNNKKIKYEKVNVDLDQKEAEDMVRKTGQMGVPVTSLLYEDGSEKLIVGFDKPALEQVLKTEIN
jgi:glutaredoxin 3